MKSIDLQSKLMDRILTAQHKQTPSTLVDWAATALNLTRRQVRAALNQLIAQGDLEYTNEWGHTFVRPAFHRPVRLSDRTIVKPPSVDYVCSGGEIAINLLSGASFGSGRHPSTRLALAGIEYCLISNRLSERRSQVRVLDIGTGSGILALAALKHGAHRALGTDIDPCAISEAKTNAALNTLTDRMDVKNTELRNIRPSYELICANLRLPTLKSIASDIRRLCESEGMVVLAGIHRDEAEQIIVAFGRLGLTQTWQANVENWTAIVCEVKGA